MSDLDPHTRRPDQDDLMRKFTGDSELDQVAQATHPMLAMALLEHFPGVELRVPHKMHEGHYLAKALGIEFATHLTFYAGGDTLSIPTKHPASRDALQMRVARMTVQGKNRRETALACGISQRHVRRLAAKMGLTQRQINQHAVKPLPAPPESVSNGGLTAGLVDFGPYDPLPPQKAPQRASESKYGIYTPQPQKDQS